jgi:lipopolysaccharide transport system ATP-binding protein
LNGRELAVAVGARPKDRTSSGGDVAVAIDNVSKRFSRSFKHALWYGARDVAKEVIGVGQEADDLREHEFWALRNVSFAVARGESVGLVGHNGAGKTTLLKLIHGLMKPSRGAIRVTGSVRALIALGTGFNPVLTGRENIQVASAVLGYSDRETRDKLEEIVAFSEIDEFIDAPVQSYSSGMLARLGFSVAVHTQPDILLVDEVLAVGDLNFAIKCYRKIAEFRNDGGSILLVSHNPYAIRTNCDRAVWIEHGIVQMIDRAHDVCDAYEAAVARQDEALSEEQFSDGTVRLVSLRYPETVRSGGEFFVEAEFDVARPLSRPVVAVTLAALTGQPIVANVSVTDNVELSMLPGTNVVRVRYDEVPLARGVYSISVVVAEESMNNQVLAVLNVGRFEVSVAGDDLGAGLLRLHPTWESFRGDGRADL